MLDEEQTGLTQSPQQRPAAPEEQPEPSLESAASVESTASIPTESVPTAAAEQPAESKQPAAEAYPSFSEEADSFRHPFPTEEPGRRFGYGMPQQPWQPFSQQSASFGTGASATPFGGISGYSMPETLHQPPKKPRLPKDTRKLRAVLIILAVLVFAALLYCMVRDIYMYRTEPNAVKITAETVRPNVVLEMQEKPELDPSDPLVDESGRYSVEGVAKVVRPSIVELYGYTESGTLVGSGSGIIVSEDGYIVTNAHVLMDNAVYEVVTEDGTRYDASIVGRDTKTDIAVIQIAATGLPAATIGNSDEVVVGESVVAIGNPAGLTGSVTNGIVSGLNRQIRADSTGFDMDCIQTNAAISPGNSGGALVNMYGQVIGITSSKYVSSSYEGLGFAITINQALPVIQELMEQGYVSGRVRVGISFISMQNEYAQAQFSEEVGVKDPEPDGVWITEISEDCDISHTELAVNDVIVSVEGKNVNDYDSLNAAIAGKVGGDTVKAVCRRYRKDGTYQEFTISFQLMEDTSGNY